MGFEFLFAPFEATDAWLTGLIADAPLLAALALATILGLRHASDPDHLVAVSSLVVAQEGERRVAEAGRLGAWWGVGHAATLLAVGLPLIALKTELPGWLEAGAERLVGVIVLALALRLIVRWARGGYRTAAHRHTGSPEAHRHLHLGPHRHAPRTPRQALAIGVVHGLAGTGAIVVLLIAALPGRLEAAAALGVFAPMSVISMATLTGAFAWVLTRPRVDPLFRSVLIPALGVFGVLFGAWYAS